MHVLVVNCGSSSLKFQLIALPDEQVVAKGIIERIGQEVDAQFSYETEAGEFPQTAVAAADHTSAMTLVIRALSSGETAVLSSEEDVGAFGHRVVHGGERFTGAVRINADVIDCIDECIPLAPLHNPANLAGIRACQAALPRVPNVAVFDTAFHQTMPPRAFHYALPYEYYERYRVRRYGFHGSSHQYVTETFAQLNDRPLESVNLVTCHLGNGSSLTAVENGRSVDTSMGFTPLQGVIMGTRSGDIDPALVFYLMENAGLTVAQVNELLNKESGLLGFSGVSSDMRDVERAAQDGNSRAARVIDMWAYGIAKYIAAYLGTMPRADAIVFTAGIGENSYSLRRRICDCASGLGLVLDDELNRQHGRAHCISTASSRVPVWVIPTNEELQIARETYHLVNAHSS